MIEIKYKHKVYKLDKAKLLKVLSKLTSCEVKEEEIEPLMKKFNLYDDIFIKQINNL